MNVTLLEHAQVIIRLHNRLCIWLHIQSFAGHPYGTYTLNRHLHDCTKDDITSCNHAYHTCKFNRPETKLKPFLQRHICTKMDSHAGTGRVDPLLCLHDHQWSHTPAVSQTILLVLMDGTYSGHKILCVRAVLARFTSTYAMSKYFFPPPPPPLLALQEEVLPCFAGGDAPLLCRRRCSLAEGGAPLQEEVLPCFAGGGAPLQEEVLPCFAKCFKRSILVAA